MAMPAEFENPHAAFVASPGMGHLIPMLELAKTLVTHQGFHVTLFVVATDHASTSLLKSPTYQHDHIDIVSLPVIDHGSTDPNASVVTKLLLIMRESLPSLRSSIAAMKSKPTALVVDLFGTYALTIADQYGMLRYMFDTSHAWFLAVFLYSSSIDIKVILEEHVKCQKPLKIPGCKSLDFEDTFLDVDFFHEFKIVAINMTKTDGILINTWEDLEPSTIKSLVDDNLLGKIVKVPIYPIGPMVRKGEKKVPKNDEVKIWLDKQPSESVIYVSFGSGGTLSAEQITDLAWGLEQSRQRFIWVVRPPSENSEGAYFSSTSTEKGDGTPNYLPQGFFTRTKDIGLVIPMWAPQAQILSHPSTGGFLSHCGWNSILECIWNRLPMIAWPLYGEQKMNGSLLTEELRIAVRPKAWPSEEIVGRDEIEKMVRKIMVADDEEGQAIRKRVKELRQSTDNALSKGGSSFNSLSQFTKCCFNHLQA